MRLHHLLTNVLTRGLAGFTDRSASEVLDYTPTVYPGGKSVILSDARWLVPTQGSLALNSPDGLSASIAPGAVALATKGCTVQGDIDFASLALPDYRGGTAVFSRLPNGPVEGTNAVVNRFLTGENVFGHSVSRLTLRNDIPLHVPTEGAVTALFVIQGAAMAFSCKPGEDELIPDFTRFLIDQRIEPENLALTAVTSHEGRMQETLDAWLARAYGNQLDRRPAIGDPDSGLNYAQPLLTGSMLVAYPGDLLYLSSVATWGQCEVMALRATLPL